MILSTHPGAVNTGPAPPPSSRSFTDPIYRRRAKVACDTEHGLPRGARALDRRPVLHAADGRGVRDGIRRGVAHRARGAAEVPGGVHYTADDEQGAERDGEGPGAGEGPVGADGEDVGGYWGLESLAAFSFEETGGPQGHGLSFWSSWLQCYSSSYQETLERCQRWLAALLRRSQCSTHSVRSSGNRCDRCYILGLLPAATGGAVVSYRRIDEDPTPK